MTRDQIVAIIKARLLRADDSTIDAKIVTEMQYVQEQLLENAVVLPWFLLSEFETIDTDPDEERLPLPTGFLREHEECSMWIYDSVNEEWLPLGRDDYEVLANTHKEPGQPEAYALDGMYFRLKPTPDDIYTIRTRFYIRDAALSTNIENKWLLYASDLMVAETCYIMAGTYLKDNDLAAKFQPDITRARDRINIVNEARAHTNRNYMMGDN